MPPLDPITQPTQLPAVISTAATTTPSISTIQDAFGVYCVLEVCDLDVDPATGKTAESNPVYHVFPVMPESLQMAQRYLQTVTPTAGGVFVDDYGAAPSPIVLTGTFGMFPNFLKLPSTLERLTGNSSNTTHSTNASAPTILIPGSTLKNSDIPNLTGYKLVKLMSQIVDYAHRPGGKKSLPRRAKFYNFAFDRYYEVAIDSFEATMSVQQNNLWFYTLQLTAIRELQDVETQATTLAKSWALIDQAASDTADVVAKAQAGPTSFMPPAVSSALSILGKIDNTVNAVVRTVTRLSPGSVVGLAANQLDGLLHLPTGTTQQFLSYAAQVPNYVQAVTNVLNQVNNRLPSDTVRDINNARTALGQMQAALHGATLLPTIPSLSLRGTGGGTYQSTPSSTNPIPEVDASVVEISEMSLNMEHALNGMDVMLASNGLTLSDLATQEAVSAVATTGPSSGPQLTPQPSLNGARHYVVHQGDTLAQLSQTFYSDPEQWPLIVQANTSVFTDMLLPAPGEDLSDYVGDVLAIPTTQSFTPAQADPFVLDAAVGTRALGTDLSHTPTTTTRSDGTLDLEVLDPVSTLLEGIWHRLSTPVGAIPDVPSYGSRVPAVVGENFGTLTTAMTIARTTEALSQDARLTSVTNVSVDFNSGNNAAATISFNASVVNQGQLGTIAATLSANT